MRTWWIVKTLRGRGQDITSTPGPWVKQGHLPTSAIGPFWTYKEAMEVLHVWTK